MRFKISLMLTRMRSTATYCTRLPTIETDVKTTSSSGTNMRIFMSLATTSTNKVTYLNGLLVAFTLHSASGDPIQGSEDYSSMLRKLSKMLRIRSYKA